MSRATKGLIVAEAYFEYFCKDCLQLRLCCDSPERSHCGACGSTNITKGEICTLDKEALIKEHNNK